MPTNVQQKQVSHQTRVNRICSPILSIMTFTPISTLAHRCLIVLLTHSFRLTEPCRPRSLEYLGGFRKLFHPEAPQATQGSRSRRRRLHTNNPPVTDQGNALNVEIAEVCLVLLECLGVHRCAQVASLIGCTLSRLTKTICSPSHLNRIVRFPLKARNSGISVIWSSGHLDRGVNGFVTSGAARVSSSRCASNSFHYHRHNHHHYLRYCND